MARMRRYTKEPAPAKLNLALSVGPPHDGHVMHPIASWMVTLDYVDDLHVTRLSDDSISRYAIQWPQDAKRPSEIDWSVRDDLAVRAHQAVERYTDRRLPVQMRLEKRIPAGGGLGGGSSDAAAMIRACNQLFDLELDHDAMCHIAASLGSDIPFLIRGGSAVVTGFGEQLRQLSELPSLCAVLCFPDHSCPTGAVYGRFDAGGSASLREDAIEDAIASSTCFNDLADAAMEEAPALRANQRMIGDLAQRDVHVSGSGSTLFLTCDTQLEAGALASAIEEQCEIPAVAARPTRVEQGLIESID